MFSDCEITKDISRAKRFFENIISYTVGPYTLSDIIEHRLDSVNIVDVREYEDYIKGHIPYAIHISYKEIQKNTGMFDKNKITVFYTYSDSCPRAYTASVDLLEKHFPSVVLRGGFREWKKLDFDIIKTDGD